MNFDKEAKRLLLKELSLNITRRPTSRIIKFWETSSKKFSYKYIHKYKKELRKIVNYVIGTDIMSQYFYNLYINEKYVIIYEIKCSTEKVADNFMIRLNELNSQTN